MTCWLSWALAIIGAAIAVLACMATYVFVRISRGYRAESRAQISRMGTSIVQLAEENSELRNMNSQLQARCVNAETALAEIQRLRGGDGTN